MTPPCQATKAHPDAGKTTLTEKLLLYAGAVQLAGSVTDRKRQRATVSDWMELERKRGISVSSTVLQFNYGDYRSGGACTAMSAGHCPRKPREHLPLVGAVHGFMPHSGDFFKLVFLYHMALNGVQVVRGFSW